MSHISFDHGDDEGTFELADPLPAVERLRIGVDLGSRTVGWAIVGCTKDWIPFQELGRGVVRHDGAIGDAEKEITRKSLRAASRRSRVRYENRRKRRKALKTERESIAANNDGFKHHAAPLAELSERPDVAAWVARLALTRPIMDRKEAEFMLPLALLHVQKHPGQRNPFHSLRRSRADVESGLT